MFTALAGSVIALSPAASADGGKDVHAEIAAAQGRLDGLNNTAEIAAERYNGALLRLGVAQQAATAAKQQVGEATARLDGLRTQAGAMAAAAYQSGLSSSGLAMLARPGGPADYLSRLSTLDIVARDQAALIDQVAVARHDQATARARANEALGAERRVVGQLGTAKSQVEADAQQAQQVLQQLQAKQDELIRQAQAAVAKAAANQQAAAAAAARQAEDQARAQAAALARQAAQAVQSTQSFVKQTAAPVTAPLRPRSHSSGSAGNTGGASSGSSAGSGGAATAVRWAYAELGKPYVWGAAGPNSFDCSGLTQYAWGKAGVSLDHFTGAQWNEGRHVSRSELQPGDLVFFYSDLHHMAMYVGGGDIIEAPHTGDVVKKVSLSYMPSYQGAVRPLG